MKHINKFESFKTNENNDHEFDYMMLGRLQSDVEYFLGNGSGSERVLYYGNVKEHIQAMKDLWNKLPEDGKPEWLSYEEIEDYEKKMLQYNN